jgi:hypothetical protein
LIPVSLNDTGVTWSCLNGGGDAASCKVSVGCHGSIFYGCEDGHQWQFDCASEGKACVSTSVGTQCVDGTCDGSFVERCKGSVVQVCDGKILTEHDCGEQAGTCMIGPTGPLWTRCIANLASCMASPVGDYDYGVRCEGSLRVDCLLGNEIPFDCSKVGLGCVPVLASTQAVPPQQVQVARCQAGADQGGRCTR